jgi:predicted dehydrogenase
LETFEEASESLCPAKAAALEYLEDNVIAHTPCLKPSAGGNKRTILIVGTGSIGERHLRCFATMKRAEVALCEINATLRNSVAERYSVERVYAHFEEALASKPDAVVICTPAHLHVPIALKAARAGVSMLIEKPLGVSLEGVDDLLFEVKRRELSAAVAYVYRAHPALRSMRDSLVSGRFGKPVQIVAVCGQHFPLYRPAYRNIYYKDRLLGGGAVQDALTHIINAGEWLIGPIDSLIGDVGHQLLDGVSVEDTAHVLTRHGKVMGCYSLNQYQAPNETTITVVCERGTVRFEYHENRWRWMTEPGGRWQNEQVVRFERDTLFTLQADSFLGTLDGRAGPLCSLEEAKQSLRINLGILRSARDGRWISTA